MKKMILRGRMGGPVARAMALACLTPLGACASFDGQPRPVIQPVLAVPGTYQPSTALTYYYGLQTPGTRKSYRNTVIGIYMTSVDANFIEFRRNLSREVKGANFGLGTGVVALTTAGSFAAERAANILSAGAAALSGTQGKLSREVYFEKTLPALFSGMEANRTKVRTDIFTRMPEEDSYTLTEALSDLARYEAAASLDQAIQTMTTETAEKAEEEQARFENVLGLGGIVEPGARVELRQLTTKIDGLVASSPSDLKKISIHLKLSTTVSDEDQATNINRKLRDMASQDPAALTKFVEEMKAKGVDLTQGGS